MLLARKTFPSLFSSAANINLPSAKLYIFSIPNIVETGTGEAVVVDSEPSQVIYVDPASQGTVVGVPPSLEQRIILESTPQRTVVANPATGDAVRVITVPGQDQPEVLPGMVEINPSSSDIVELEAPAGSAAVISVEDDEQATITQKRTATGQVVPHVKAKKRKHHSRAAAPATLDAATLEAVPYLNMEGFVEHILVGKDYVDFKLKNGHLDGYQNEPQHRSAFLSVPQAVAYLERRPLSHFVLDINDTASPHSLSFKISKISKIDNQTLRVFPENPAQITELAPLAATLKNGPVPFRAISLRLANFAGKGDAAVPLKDRVDYLVAVKEGLHVTQISPNHWKFHFKNITPSLLHVKGASTPLPSAHLMKSLKENTKHGAGRLVPFKPNGSVVVFDKAGNPLRLTLEFSNFAYDEKTNTFTADANPLTAAWSDSDVVVPVPLETGTPLVSPYPTLLFLDVGDLHAVRFG